MVKGWSLVDELAAGYAQLGVASDFINQTEPSDQYKLLDL